jgi:hypothetical protein
MGGAAADIQNVALAALGEQLPLKLPVQDADRGLALPYPTVQDLALVRTDDVALRGRLWCQVAFSRREASRTIFDDSQRW